jgi:L-seryl-tRNA(Ser) seleniumtransferase
MVQESVQAGAALVAFSGDKLLGGPQSGILVGERAAIELLRRHPLQRALRPDKLCLAALRATLVPYLKGDATREIPVWQMITTTEEALRSRASLWRAGLGSGDVTPGRSTVGGGSLPEESLPTWTLALTTRSADRLLRRLRGAQPPVIGRIDTGRVVLDPRTVLPDQDEVLVRAVQVAIKDSG